MKQTRIWGPSGWLVEIKVSGLKGLFGRFRRGNLGGGPGIVITEWGEDENMLAGDESAPGTSQCHQHSERIRKGKVAAHKASRRKSVVMSLPAMAVVISNVPSSHMESPFEGLADLPISDDVSLQHNTGLEGLRSALDLEEPTPSTATTTGWLGLTHACIHFTASHNWNIWADQFTAITNFVSLFTLQIQCRSNHLCSEASASHANLPVHTGSPAGMILTIIAVIPARTGITMTEKELEKWRERKRKRGKERGEIGTAFGHALPHLRFHCWKNLCSRIV